MKKYLLVFFILTILSTTQSGLLSHVVAYEVGKSNGRFEVERSQQHTVDSLQIVIVNLQLHVDHLQQYTDSLQKVIVKKKVHNDKTKY